MKAVSIPDFEEAHDPHWVLKSAFQLLVFAFVFTEALLAFALQRGFSWVAVILVIVAAHLMHGTLIGLHEAAHGLLRRNRQFNEFDGVVIGTLSLLPFSLYRAVHQTHHAYLATQKDCEFWPLSYPSVARWKRCLAAFCELNLGLFYGPFLFLRAFFTSRSPVRNKRVRARIWSELVLMAVVWALILGAVAAFGLWKYFIWMYLVPALLAGNMQSWRKYIEHVGLTSDTVNGSTRSIVAKSWLGRLLAFSLLHEPFHGVHHQRAGLPHSVLPQYVDKLQPKSAGERIPYPSYRNALPELMRCLADPRVGPQWRAVESIG
jgi:fatty acid desaturase